MWLLYLDLSHDCGVFLCNFFNEPLNAVHVGYFQVGACSQCYQWAFWIQASTFPQSVSRIHS